MNSVSIMLSEDVPHDYIEELLVKTSLAVASHCASRRYYYYRLYLIPSTVQLLKELAESVRSELPNEGCICAKLRELEDHKVAALLEPDPRLYEAVYGCKLEDVLKLLAIRGIVYRGVVSSLMLDKVRKCSLKLVYERSCHIMQEYIVPILKSLNYEVDVSQ